MVISPHERITRGAYSALDDRLLVLDFQAGNPQAFVEIHRRYGSLARHVCGRFLHSQQDADDAFQETMVRVFQGLYRFNGRYALQPWIARIAKNVSLDLLRGQARRPRSDDSAPASDELPQPGDLADEIVERLVQRDTVLSVLSDLPETHRRALMLRELEGCSHREIARELEISTAQAKALIHRAKGSFRRRWLEKVADRGGLMGIAFLPLLWLAHAAHGFRRVAERLGHVAQGAQAVVPEGLTSTVSATASAAPTVTGLSERLVAAGMTLLLAGGVTVGAAKVLTDRTEEPAERASLNTPAPVTKHRAESRRQDAPAMFDERLYRDSEIAEPPIGIVPSPSPTVEPSAEPVVDPEQDPSLTTEPTQAPTPEPPPPAPEWSMTVSSNLISEATCDCGAAQLIRTNDDGTPGDDVSWYQKAWSPVLDGEGNVAWLVAIEHRAWVQEGLGRMDVRFTLRTGDGIFGYTGRAILSETIRNDEGGYSYRFVGSFRSKTSIPEEAVVPRQGQLTAEVALWTDGTPYLGSFSLVEA
jgi:RNA polymerase sigma factor (sigma-70 family)